MNFALFSQHASAVELCLFDSASSPAERERIPLRERTSAVWHAYLPDVRPGQVYGYRVHGPYDPLAGHRFNPHKLLLDPHARAVSGGLVWDDALYGYAPGAESWDAGPSRRDDAAYVPKGAVVDDAWAWGGDRPPRVPWTRTVIYECHVKGMTARHPGVLGHLRGTFLGLAAEPVLDHLLSLGVTAVELLPVHFGLSERGLVDRGLANYWGYSTIGYFAPDRRFASRPGGDAVGEFRSMVQALHRAGIEVILDVAFGHTGERDERGPTLCMRGIDNAVYYRLDPERPGSYFDPTGCGNSLNTSHPRVLQLMFDSLRYWVTEMHVDGFRFDLAPALARNPREFDQSCAFFATIQQDPVLSRVKLIAEPWDLGAGGYRLGSFPAGWAEWNDRYRDETRRFWSGDGGQLADLASRLAGSSDVFGAGDRGPSASINYVTCHDGFTLADLVSYKRKHNEANGEHNRDGADENYSRNWGVEGPTDRPATLQMRERTKRNLIATLAFSQGVPMISHGDELGRTQRGNNNAYCQDNELSWVDWRLDEQQRELLAFVSTAFALRRENGLLRRRRFFPPSTGPEDRLVAWLRPDGLEMTRGDWEESKSSVLGMLVHGRAADEDGDRSRADRPDMLLLVNGGPRPRLFKLPGSAAAGAWCEILSTAPAMRPHAGPGAVRLQARALVLLARKVQE